MSPSFRLVVAALLATAGYLSAPSARAQTAAAAAPGARTEPLGRLFFTADRRATLDRQRQLNIQETQQTEDPTVTVSGVVRRSSGPETAWVNGVPQASNAPGAIWSGKAGSAAGIRLSPPGEVPRQISVGETLHRSSGDVSSAMRGGTITVRRSSPAKP